MDAETAAGAPHLWREIGLAPLDEAAEAVLERILEELSRHTELPCRRLPAPAGGPSLQVPGRSQVDADRLLERVEAAAAATAPLVVVAGQDFGVPLFTFVFGRARLGGRAAVVSLARLRPEFYGLPEDSGLLARRAAAEILHELGHVAGRAHCADRSCLMSFASSVEAADERGLGFCAECAAALPHGLARPRGPLAAAEL
jgi:archaemetzincin